MGVKTAALAAVAALSCAAIAATGACSFDSSSNVSSDGGADPDAVFLNLPCRTDSDYVDRDGTFHRYRYVSEVEVYDEAFAECAADGAHLVVIDDGAENDFVLDMIAADTWIGLDDLTTETVFRWVTGDAVRFDAFNEGEPNDNGTLPEDCVHMFGPTTMTPGLWNDANCGQTRGFVCECDPTVVVPPPPSCMDDSDYEGEVHDGRRYKGGRSSSWDDARADCLADGADLVAIADDLEDAIVQQASQAAGLAVWIGYSDRRMEDVFEWSNGAPMDFENFAAGQPNDGEEKEVQDCVHMSETSLSWHDDDCAAQHDFVCECDPSVR